MTGPGRGSDAVRPTASFLSLRPGERWRAAAALAASVSAELAGIGLLATSAWLIATASHRPPILTLTMAIVGE
ncbi:MAG: hypothetical protein M0007_01930, partial [Actinomycetota bacterium]|nr:hypothetical protein [Actinomycetota bacterium]